MGERESELIPVNGAIMEPLCLVKSHEINRVTAGMYSAAKRGRESLVQWLVFVSIANLGIKSINFFSCPIKCDCFTKSSRSYRACSLCNYSINGCFQN